MHELERELSFETLLADISSRFVNIPAQQVDREIEDSLRLICESLSVDSSTIFLRDADDPDSYVLTYVHRDPELLSPPKTGFTASQNFPWCNRKLIANEIICLPDIEAAPPEAAVDKAMWRKFGISSALVIPLSTGGRRPEGFWGIDSTSGKRDWPQPLQKRLKLVADVFANALERAEAERQLQEREQRLRLAANIADAGFWTIDFETGVIWTTPKLKKLFGLEPEDTLTTELLFRIVHPEDRERVIHAIELMSGGHEETAEYRIIPPGDSIRWLMSRGNQYEYAAGKSRILTGITIDVTQRHILEETMRAWSGRLLDAQEAERKRLARELHDDINQRVAMITMGLSQVRQADNLPRAEQDKISELIKDAQSLAKEIQALSHELHSASLEYLGIVPAVAGLCIELRKRHNVEIHLVHNDVPKSLRPEIALALFRITQEAIHNALKYSGASELAVELLATRSQVELTVRDAGAGFDVNAATQGRGLGLISMRERALALKGNLAIHSQPGRGTEVCVRIPLRVAESSDRVPAP